MILMLRHLLRAASPSPSSAPVNLTKSRLFQPPILTLKGRPTEPSSRSDISVSIYSKGPVREQDFLGDKGEYRA